MRKRTAEEILSFTFAHLDTVLREKRQTKEEVRELGERSNALWRQKDPAAPDNAAGANIAGEKA